MRTTLPYQYQTDVERSFAQVNTLQEKDKPFWSETLNAQYGYHFGRIKERVSDTFQYGRDPTRTGLFAKREEGYNAFNDLEGYEEYADYLTANAVNKDHMYVLKNRIELNKRDRQTLADSSLFNQFTAGFFDPINLIALPFGGPTLGIMRSGLRVGAGVAALSAGQEIMRAPIDPLNTPWESPLNIGIGFIGGGVLGMAGGILPTRRALASRRMQKEADAFMANVGGITAGDYSGPNAINRSRFTKMSDEKLLKEKEILDEKIRVLSDEHSNIESSFNQDTELRGIPSRESISTYDRKLELEEQLSDAKQAVAPFKIETKLRNIDKALKGEVDFKIDSNAFADGLLYNLVSVPLRRIINSKAGNKTKLLTMRLASDNGFGTTLTQMNITLPRGVYELSQTRYGELYSNLSKMTNDWAEHGGRGEAFTKGNYNISNFGQRISNRINKVRDDDVLNIPADKLTLQQYMRQINWHRINKTSADNLSEAQRRSVATLTDFYNLYNKRLQDVGLLGTTQSIKKDLSVRQKDLIELEKQLKSHNKLKSDDVEFKSILEARIKEVKEEISDAEASLSFSSDFIDDAEPFNPRYYNTEMILANREEFTNLIIDSYKRNPSIYVKQKGKWVKERLEDDDVSIRLRAEKTVANILNEKDTINLDNTYQGAGMSKHLKHRQISLTNAELYKFLHDDPLKVMRAYVSKTAPAYEFQRAFGGKNIADLRHEIITDTINNGGTVKEGQEYFKEFGHLYKRIVGTVVTEPNKLSYRFANVIRTAAQLNFLGRAVYSTVSEPAKLFHDHAFKDVFKGFATLVEAGVGKTKPQMQANEVMLAGEALDIVLQSTHLRFMDDLKANPLQNNIWDKTTDVFFTLNGLAPVTNMFKQWDGILRQHTLIDNSIKWVEGTATKQEIYYLNKYGIDEDTAFKISKAPWEKTHRGLYFANTEEWLSTKQFKHIANLDIRSLDNKHIDWPSNLKGKSSGVFKPRVKHTTTKTEDVVEAIDNETGEILGEFPTKTTEIDSTGSSVFDKETGEIIKQFPKGTGFMKKTRTTENVSYSYKKPIIFLDKDSIYDEFDRKVWTKQRIKGAETLPELTFLTKEDWYNFVKMRESTEVMNARFKEGRKFTESAVEYENRINKLALKEFNKQQSVDVKTLETFRTALNTGVLNTILMGTPADKPIINDGIVYIPMNVAKQFKMQEDDLIKGYAKIENGILGLPFQFYSYSLAAVSKISGSFAQGQVKNRTAAITSALILAYIGQKLRTNDYTWEKMNYADRFARSLDYSGLASLHTALLYEAFHTSLALGGPDISNGLLQPKYNVNDDGPVETVAGLGGAGPSIFFDFSKNAFTLATGREIGYAEGGLALLDGDRGQAAAGIIRKMPFMTLPGIYGLSRSGAKAVDDNWD